MPGVLENGRSRPRPAGKRPVNINVQAYYNLEKPDFAADWSIRIQMTLLFPK